MTKPWRSMPDPHALAERFGDFAARKWTQGLVDHGNQFVGDPYEHAMEEAADLVMYIEKLKDRCHEAEVLLAATTGLSIRALKAVETLEDPPKEVREWITQAESYLGGLIGTLEQKEET